MLFNMGKNQPWLPLILINLSLITCFVEDRAIYMVLMEGEPVAFREHGTIIDPDSESAKAHEKHLVESHDRILESSLEAGSYNKLYSFHHIVNGFAVHTTPSQAKKLEKADGVTWVEKDRGVKLKTTYSPHFLHLPEAVWATGGGERNAGEGIVIGFIDTGIDPTHPSFSYDPLDPYRVNPTQFRGVCESGLRFWAGSCNGKIVSARYFSAGAASIMPLNASRDFLSPFDAIGHGSHVASTAAGNWGVPVVVNGLSYGRASGMAPRARIAVYKAIYPDVGTLADVVSAIDQATRDGVDVLTLSIGPDEPPTETPTFLSVLDMFLLYARKAGVFVVQAAGNKGPGPATVVSFGPWVMGVGASTTDRSYVGTLVTGDGQEIHGVGLSESTFGNGLLKFKLVSARDAMMKNNGTFPTGYVEECQHPEALDPAVVQGSIVICSFSAGFYNGTSTVPAILDTAQTLGFIGFALVANPVFGDIIAVPLPYSIPGIIIPKLADAQILLAYYEKQTTRNAGGFVTRYGGRAAIREGRVASFNGEAPMVTRYSSRGPDVMDINLNIPADVLKPEILAPGDLIWAAWSPMSVADPILSGYNFALLSGTSMATPHAAGIAALIKQSHPTWTPSMIASAMSTTASAYDNRGQPIMAHGEDLTQLFPATPFDCGAGLINPSHAIDPGLVLPTEFEDYIKFLCALPNIDTSKIKAITGRTCNASLPCPSDLNLPSITISAVKGFHSVRRLVKSVATKPETYLCSILQPEGVEVSIYPPNFTILPQESVDLEVRFQVTQALGNFSFGEVVLTGSLDHIFRMPVSVFPVSL